MIPPSGRRSSTAAIPSVSSPGLSRPSARSWGRLRIVAGMTATDRPLLLTRDPDLLDDLRRLSVAAGVEPEVVSDRRLVATAAGRPRRWWSSATTSPTRWRPRPWPGGADVVVASHAVDTDLPWRAALALGAEHVVGLPDGESFLVDRLAHGRWCSADPRPRGRRRRRVGRCRGERARHRARPRAHDVAARSASSTSIPAPVASTSCSVPRTSRACGGPSWRRCPGSSSPRRCAAPCPRRTASTCSRSTGREPTPCR